jgi:ribose-phosphate pyrophosphokinase
MLAPPIIVAGNSNTELASKVATQLQCPDPYDNIDVGSFSDGEVSVQINTNVRGRTVFIVQPTCHPTNRSLMELLVISDALRRSSAGRIVAVIPYLGYSRQDKRARSGRVPITSKLVANLIETAGVDHALTVDLHSDQLQGFFDIPVDNIWASGMFVSHMIEEIRDRGLGADDVMVVSPDVGGVLRARGVANHLGVDLAIIDKRRPRANVSEVMNLIGDVEGKTCIISDDMIDTAGTLAKAANALHERGATAVIAYATHAVFSGNAIDNIQNSKLDSVVVSDSIPLRKKAALCDKVHVLSLDWLLAEAIRRLYNEESITSMFK